MSDLVHWGILGAGRIARKFAASLRELPDARLSAIGSRDAGRAKALADEFGVARPHASYEGLAHDPGVNAVYVATRHPSHLAAMRLCLEASKAVLCEKPFTVNAREAAAAIRLAREKKVFLMEAMWTRFFPAMIRLRERVAAGCIGEPRLLQGDFGFLNDWRPEGRHLSVELGGGALLDVGVYLVSLSSMLFGPPDEIASSAFIGSTGVDETCAMVFRHGRGQVSSLAAAIRTDTRKEATIYGTEGRIDLPVPFWKPHTFSVVPLKGEAQRVEIPFPNFGYQFEAAHVMECLRQGRLESEVMPLDETLSIMETLDRVRAPWGLRYPADAGG